MKDAKTKQWENWFEAWSGIIVCGKCTALINDLKCPFCHNEHKAFPFIKVPHKQDHEMPIVAMAGGMDYTTYVFLNLIFREWQRPLDEKEQLYYEGKEIPQKLLVVMLFWSLFEHLIDRFFTDALRNVREGILKDLMKRYSSIGSRIEQLYKILFSCTIKEDLSETGYMHIYEHIRNVQEKRNRFIHGDAGAIDEKLVLDTIKLLQESQKAWIKLYNMRCAIKINEGKESS